MRIFIFRDFKDFFEDLGGFGDLVPVLVSPTGIDTFFVIAKWTVLEAQEELDGAPQHATLGDA